MRSVLLAGVASALLSTAAAAQTDPANLSETVRTLASDRFGGRGPGTAGEKVTVDWLVAKFKSLGLGPGGTDARGRRRCR